MNTLRIFVISALIAYALYQQMNQPESPLVVNEASPIIIVGGGLAGLSAALTAFHEGKTVWLLEKEPKLGGNSAKASSGINGVWTRAQKTVNSLDTPESFFGDTIHSGGGGCNEELVHILVNNSAFAIEWLENFGIDLSVLSKNGGHSHARTHRARAPPADKPAVNIGYEITSKLIHEISKYAVDPSHEKPAIHVLTNAKVEKLMILPDFTNVVGVAWKNLTLKEEDRKEEHLFGKAVILASGGYAADTTGLLKKYVPHLSGLPTTNGNWAKGEGVIMAEKIGAKLTLMDQVQIHPTGFVDPSNPTNPTKFLAPEALRGVGGILLDKHGERFVDELNLRSEVSDKIFARGFNLTEAGPVCVYLVLNDEAVEAFQPSALKFYKSKGFITEYKNVEEFAKSSNIDFSTLQRTLISYNEFKAGEKKDPFGKTTFPVSFNPDSTLHIILVTPSIHYTMGGVQIDGNGEVFSEKVGTNFKGLYACGEVSGGVHGFNRLAGNSLLECVVFGTKVGKNAADYVPLIAKP